MFLLRERRWLLLFRYHNFMYSFNFSVEREWTALSDALAGLMCASLRAVPQDALIPELSFRPSSRGPFGMGSLPDAAIAEFKTHVRYSSLPRETVCTENMTPWAKLLPCDVKVFIHSSLPTYQSRRGGF